MSEALSTGCKGRKVHGKSNNLCLFSAFMRHALEMQRLRWVFTNKHNSDDNWPALDVEDHAPYKDPDQLVCLTMVIVVGF